MSKNAESASHEASYQGWHQHNTSPRQNTELVVQELLRAKYPDHHVTLTQPSRCDLWGYAAAGHAAAVQFEDSLTHAVRFYRPPRFRLSAGEGTMVDNVVFGSWTYKWNDFEYFVYLLDYRDPGLGEQKHFFVLHASDPGQRTCPATDALLVASGIWTKELHDEIFVFDNARWTKSKDLWRSVEGASWDDVILDAQMKKSLIDDVQNFFDARPVYQTMKVPWKRGIILHGVPGNGKTLSIKALMNSLHKRDVPVPALYVKSLDACHGPKWSIQHIFKKARAMAPCLLVFEDLDSMVTAKTRSYFLNEVDGLESNDGVLMIGSTNHLDLLDPAITKRPSRFDRKYHFALPGEEQRSRYCQFWARKFVDSDDVDFPDAICPLIAKMTEGFSFAYLKEMFVASLLLLARGADKEPTHAVGMDSETTHSLSSEHGVGDAAHAEQDTTKQHSENAGQTSQAANKIKPRLHMPDIPADIKDNALLCTVAAQAAMLFDEMNSTTNPAASVRLAGDSDLMPSV